MTKLEASEITKKMVQAAHDVGQASGLDMAAIILTKLATDHDRPVSHARLMALAETLKAHSKKLRDKTEATIDSIEKGDQ